MIERMPLPERDRTPRPELVAYKDNEYALVYDKPGTEVSFNVAESGSRDINDEAFDTSGYAAGATVVGLDTRDYEGKRSVFVAGTEFGDLVCRLDVVDGRASSVVYEDPDFNAVLAAGSMTIGARHHRLGDAKLTKAYALPQGGIRETTEVMPAQDGVSSPLAIAVRLVQEYLDRQK